MMRFTGNMSISEAIKEIREKLETGGQDHGLFQPFNPKVGRASRWLRGDRTFNFYDIKSGEEIVYRKKHRPLKVLLMDDSVITVIIDDSCTVAEHCVLIAEKLDLPNPEEYSLLLPNATRWLHAGETLASQNIDDGTMVVFKKKYFVTDMQIDKSDIKQLGLLYHQCQKAIVAGEYPCSTEEALSCAALQLQIDHGDFIPNKHQPGFVDAVKYLPPRNRKKKKEEQAMYRDWENLRGLKKLDAMYRYTKLCRSLATFGVQLFNVNDVVSRKGNTVKTKKIILGFSSKSIFRFDAKEGTLMTEIPLRSLKRWSALKEEFTLDFDDRHELGRYVVYCDVETGEDMARLLAGYVDIILKIRKDAGAVSEVTDAEEAEINNIAPVFGDVVDSVTTTITLGGFDQEGMQQGELGSVPQAGQASSQAARIVIADLPGAALAARRMLDDLDNQWLINSDAIAATPDQLRQNLLEQASKLGKAVSDMVNSLNSPNDQVNIDAQAVAANLKGLLDAAKLAAIGTDDQALLEAGRRVAQAVAQMLAASATLSNSPDDLAAKRALQESIEALKGATAYVKGAVQNLLVDSPSEQLLLASAKRVADAVQKLAGNVNSASQRLEPDADSTQKLLAAAKSSALAGRDVYQTAKIVAPIAVMPDAQQQLLNAGKRAFDEAQVLANAANAANLPEADMAKIAAAAKLVGDAMAQLVNSIGCVESAASAEVEGVNRALRAILDGCDTLMESAGDGLKMGTGVADVKEGKTALQTAVRSAVAGKADPALLDATEKISKDIDDLVAVSRDAVDNPKNMDYFKRLLESAQKVSAATARLLGPNSAWVPYDNARTEAKLVAAKATLLAETAKAVLPQCDDANTQKALFISTKQGEAAVAKTIIALKEASQDPRNMDAQNRFIGVLKSVAPTLQNMTSKATAAVPRIGDPKSKQSLHNAAKETTDALEALLKALGKAQTTEDKQYEEVFKSLQKTDALLEGALLDARVGSLEQLLPRTQAIKNLGGALRNLANATGGAKKGTNHEELIVASKEIAQAVQHVAQAAVSVAAATSGSANQQDIIEVSQRLVPDVTSMIVDARDRLNNPSAEAEQKLQDSSKAVSERLKDLLAATQGDTGGEECDEAVKKIIEAVKKLNPREQPSSQPRQALSEDLVVAAKQLSSQANNVAAVSRTNPKGLAPLVDPLPGQMEDVVLSANLCAASMPEPTLAKDILMTTKSIGEHLVRLVGFAKTAKTDPQADDALTKAQTGLNQEVKQLIKLTSGATPGKAQFDEAGEVIRGALNFERALPSGDYRLADLTTLVQKLRDKVQDIMRAASREPETLGGHSLEAAKISSGIVDTSRGYSEVTRELASTQVVDDACKQIRRSRTPADALKATKVVATNAPRIMAIMKKVASDERDADVRRDVALASQDVGPSLQKLLNTAKDSAQSGDTESISSAAEAMVQKLEALVRAAPVSNASYALLCASAKVAENTRELGESAAKVANRPMDGIAQTTLTVSAKETNAALDALLAAATALSLGRADCQDAMKKTQSCIADLDSAAVSAQVGLLQVPTSKTHQMAQESMVQVCKTLAVHSQDLQQVARSRDMQGVGAAATKIAATLESVVHNAKETAGTTSDPKFQLSHLKATKDIAEKLLKFLEASRDLTSDPDNKKLMADLDARQGALRDAVQALVDDLQGGVEGLRACDVAMKDIIDNAKTLADPVTTKLTYGQLRDAAVTEAKKLAADAQQLYQTAKMNPGGVGGKSKQVASTTVSLLGASKEAASVIEDPETRKAVLIGAREVAAASAKLVGFGKKVAENPSAQNKQTMNDGFKAISNAMGVLVKAIKDADVGDKAARDAATEISRVQADLDAAAIFAETGQLHLGAEKKPLQQAHEEFSKAVKELQIAADRVQQSSSKSSAENGQASQELAKATTKLAEKAKTVAIVLGDFQVQKEVLGLAKGVAVKAQQLVLSGNRVNSNPEDRAAAQRLAEAAKGVNGESSKLLNHVNTVAGEALEEIGAVEAAKQQVLKDRDATGNAPAGGNARQVIQASQELAKASGDLANNLGQSKKETIQAANALIPLNKALLQQSRSVQQLSSDANVRREIDDATKAVSSAVAELLEATKGAKKDDWEAQERVTSANDAISDRIGDLAASLQKLPQHAQESEEDKLGVEVVETLSRVQKDIEGSANNIISVPEVHLERGISSADVGPIVVKASIPITNATAQLVAAVIAQQQDLIAAARKNPRANIYRKDPQWAAGLKVTAEDVASANRAFVAAVNKLGEAGENFEDELKELEKAAKVVSAQSQKLAAQSKQKSDPGAPSAKKLTAAGHMVVEAIEGLLAAARSAAEKAKEAEAMETTREVPFEERAQQNGELKIQLEIARLEKELETVKTQGKVRQQRASALKSMVSNPLAAIESKTQGASVMADAKRHQQQGPKQ